MACRRMGARSPTTRDLSLMVSTTSTPQQPSPSPATWFLEDDDAAASTGHHFLDECHMCGRYLSKNRDIYMYKGDTPFCSEDCRDEQIRIDEHEERANRRAAKDTTIGGSSSSAQVKSRAAAVAVGVVLAGDDQESRALLLGRKYCIGV